jgi:hypothetical protein
LSEPSWDRLESHLGALAEDHLNERVDRSTFDSLCAACDADGIDRRLQQGQYDGELPRYRTPPKMRGLEDDSERLSRQVRGNHGEQCKRAEALPGKEQSEVLSAQRPTPCHRC